MWSVSTGVVSQIGSTAVQHTAPIAPGYSGGPLFDSTGELVGIHSRRLSAPGLSFSTRADLLEPMLLPDTNKGSAWFGGSLAVRPGMGSFGTQRTSTYVTLELEADVRQRVWVRVVGGVLGSERANAPWPLWGSRLRQIWTRSKRSVPRCGLDAIVERGTSATRVWESRCAALSRMDDGLRFRGLGWRLNWGPTAGGPASMSP